MKSLAYLNIFIRRVFLLIVLYSFSRIYLLFNNLDSFSSYSLFDIIEGVRFDISALLYINIPILFLLLFPTNLRSIKGFQKFINISFYTLNIPFIILNNIDIEYFRFTQKRSTIDLFYLLKLGSDAKNIIPQYIKDYWPITLFTSVQIWLLLKIKYIPNIRIKNRYNLLQGLIIFLFGAGIFILGARGGFQLKPIKPINAGELSKSKNYSLILNTPFCIFHSLKYNQLKQYNYFTSPKLDKIYTPFHHFKDLKFKEKNIIIIIMESLSREFIGKYNNEKTNTPFIDSLMNYSLVFDNAFASGIKSIEGLPAITASIPTLMDNPLITSGYAQNNFQSLPYLLSREGYQTSFFHGGFTGTMGFNNFCRKAGFQKYAGLEDYNNMADYDGTWGIYDEDFFNFYYQHLKNEKEPFFSTFFSTTLHPPFVIPDRYKDTFSQKNQVYKTVAYSDFSLQRFFDKCKNESWFSNTLFIITADHTCGTRYNSKYKNKIGKYAIPMLIFSGDSSLQGNIQNIVQQIDIMPTTLELIGYNKPFFAFGKSLIGKESWALSYLEGEYILITKNRILINKDEKYQSFQDWDLTKELKNKEDDLRKLKAIKQSYNQRMINNKLTYGD